MNEPHGLKPFGTRLPDDPHAITVSLPRWQDIVTFTTKRRGATVPEEMENGYPRFFVQRVTRRVGLVGCPVNLADIHSSSLACA